MVVFGQSIIRSWPYMLYGIFFSRRSQEVQKMNKEIPDRALPCHMQGYTDPCRDCPLWKCRYAEPQTEIPEEEA